MRKGKNISKDILINIKPCAHRIIIPLYIPYENGYYKDSFEIFKLCLFSIRKTAISLIKVTVISNGSCTSVNKKLFVLFQDRHIDELIIETEAIGKLNSILKSLRTAEERLITITDADVLFLNDWEKEVLKIFVAFPKAGVVCPTPTFRTQFWLTSNIWIKYMFSKCLQFLPVKNPEAMTLFAKSIGWSRLDEKWKDVIATLRAKNGTIAVLGNTHMVGTFKSEVFQYIPKENTKYQLGGNSEYLYIDMPVIKAGGYKLATYDNYAYHLGNTLQDWMQETFNQLKEETKYYDDFSSLKFLKPNRFEFFVSEKILRKLLYYNRFRDFVLKAKGLSSQQIKDFNG